MKIFHGDNQVKSREALKQLIDESKSQGMEISRAEAKKLTEATLEELLGSSNLFGTEQLIIIEGMHSLPRSKKKNALITQIAASSSNIILWEKRPLTKTMLKKFPQAEVREFKSSSSLFKWLDSIGSKNEREQLKLLHEAVESDGEYFCFIMLIRQIRMMIQALDGGRIAGPPFVVNKVKSQARRFTIEQLLKVHTELFELDRRQKTSQSPLNLGQELDLITLSL